MKNNYERRYIAYADTGRDFIEFEFYSFHRANSLLNKRDAIAEYIKKHGHAVKILQTTLFK